MSDNYVYYGCSLLYMSHYSELKEVLERMKKMGMKQNQIEIMGDFLCAVVGMGIPEYQDVFPDIVKRYFPPSPEEKDKHITLFSPGEDQPKRVLVLDKNMNVKEEPLALLKAPPTRLLKEEFVTPKGDILINESDLPKRTKTCKRCHRTLDISQFGINNAMDDKLQLKCRQCFKEIRDSRPESEAFNEISTKILELPIPTKFNRLDLWTAYRISTVTGFEEKKIIPVLNSMVRRNQLLRTKLKEEHAYVYWRV